MKVFEIFYKKENNLIILNSVNTIKHGFYLPYFFPLLALIIAIKQRCVMLAMSSFVVTVATMSVGHSFFGIILKILLLITFVLVAPDIKRFDLIQKGYINAGCFAVKNKQKAIKKFFTDFLSQ
jgi:hypothetical protein